MLTVPSGLTTKYGPTPTITLPPLTPILVVTDRVGGVSGGVTDSSVTVCGVSSARSGRDEDEALDPEHRRAGDLEEAVEKALSMLGAGDGPVGIVILPPGIFVKSITGAGVVDGSVESLAVL